jgi:hypothetical protein
VEFEVGSGGGRPGVGCRRPGPARSARGAGSGSVRSAGGGGAG